jgi:hypothetical protein
MFRMAYVQLFLIVVQDAAINGLAKYIDVRCGEFTCADAALEE